jgi:hypothetical protein
MPGQLRALTAAREALARNACVRCGYLLSLDTIECFHCGADRAGKLKMSRSAWWRLAAVVAIAVEVLNVFIRGVPDIGRSLADFGGTMPFLTRLALSWVWALTWCLTIAGVTLWALLARRAVVRDRLLWAALATGVLAIVATVAALQLPTLAAMQIK